eukprot:6142146-Pleurochrysis_carterae.AAC.2
MFAHPMHVLRRRQAKRHSFAEYFAYPLRGGQRIISAVDAACWSRLPCTRTSCGRSGARAVACDCIVSCRRRFLGFLLLTAPALLFPLRSQPPAHQLLLPLPRSFATGWKFAQRVSCACSTARSLRRASTD